MKKVLNFLGALLLPLIMVVSCADPVEYHPTEAITTVAVTAKAYPGANILTWKALKDAGSYTVYKTTGKGDIEEFVYSGGNTYFCDVNIEENTEYKYRIIANPVDATIHNASEKSVTIKTAKVPESESETKGKWAPSSTAFLNLAKYESDYKESDEVLERNTITAKLIATTGSTVRIKFPVKPYAKYQVKLSQKGGTALENDKAIDDSVWIAGWTYNKEAIVDLTAVYSGQKEVSVTAYPLNPCYAPSTVVSSSTLAVTDYNEITSATLTGVSAQWKNYNGGNARVRVFFVPNSFNGKEFSTNEYTIYRCEIDSSGKKENEKYEFKSIVKLGNPKKDTSVPVNKQTEYYYDDTVDINYYSNVSAVRYFVVLNHDNKMKSESVLLTIPDFADPNWDYPDPPSVTNNVSIEDIYIDINGKINAVINSPYSTPKLTYGRFDTFNEAKVAVESELSSSISLSNYGNSTYKGTSLYESKNAIVAGKYYAFRVLASYQSLDVVATCIAVARQINGVYYWEIKSGYPTNYKPYINSPTVNFTKTATGTNYDSVTLNYYSSNALYYNIYRAISDSPYDSDRDYNFTSIATTEASSYPEEDISYKDTSDELKNTSLYKYVFYKVEAVGYYAYSQSTQVNVKALPAPQNVNYSNGYLTWDTIYRATGYLIYRADSESELSGIAYDDYYATITTNTNGYRVTKDLSKGYYYALRGVIIDSYTQQIGVIGELSTAVYVEKVPAPTLTYENGMLSWNSVDEATAYYIYRTTSEDATSEDYYSYIDTSSNNTYKVSQDLSNDYYYAVRAVSQRYVSEGSYNISFDIGDFSNLIYVEKAAAPTLSYENGTLSWNAVDGATKYYIYERASESELSNPSLTDYYDTSNNNYQITPDIINNYYYAIQAYDGYCYGDLSNVICVEKASAPTLSYANGTFSWNTIDRATRYYIYRATSEAELSNLSSYNYYNYTSNSNYQIPLDFSNDYYYAIRASKYGNGDYGDLSNIVKVDKLAVTGLSYTEGYLLWDSIDANVTCYIYRASTESDLLNKSTSNYYTYTSSSSYYIGYDNYFYAIRIKYNGSYSELSEIIHAE